MIAYGTVAVAGLGGHQANAACAGHPGTCVCLAGFYVSIERRAAEGIRHGQLLGPYPAKADAESMVWRGRLLASRVDPRAEWDAYGTCRVVSPAGIRLRPGRLNRALAEREYEEAVQPTIEAERFLQRIRRPVKAVYAWAVWEAVCLGWDPPAVPRGLERAEAAQVRERIAAVAWTRTGTAPCMACGQPGRHANHTWAGHRYDPAGKEVA